MGWIKKKLLGLLAPKYIGSVVRTVLAAVAGYLAAKGLGEAGDAVKGLEDEIAAILFALIQGWSLIEKKDR